MIRKNYLITGIITGLLLTSPAYASRDPRPGSADARVKTLTYHDNDVYKLKGHYGFSTVIEFSPKEKIQTISLGDSESWQVKPTQQQNIIFLKPLEQNAETNMTVITSLRMYLFELGASKATSPASSDLTFRIKFIYPDINNNDYSNFGNISKSKFNPLSDSSVTDWNFDYSYSGSRSLRPEKAFDDGSFTYLQYKNHDTTPAVFAVDAKGNESLVNFTTQGEYLVIEKVGRQFTLRDGDTSTCIFNDAYKKDTGNQNVATPLTSLQEKKATGRKTASSVLKPSRQKSASLSDNAEDHSFFSFLGDGPTTPFKHSEFND